MGFYGSLSTFRGEEERGMGGRHNLPITSSWNHFISLSYTTSLNRCGELGFFPSCHLVAKFQGFSSYGRQTGQSLSFTFLVSVFSFKYFTLKLSFIFKKKSVISLREQNLTQHIPNQQYSTQFYAFWRSHQITPLGILNANRGVKNGIPPSFTLLYDDVISALK